MTYFSEVFQQHLHTKSSVRNMNLFGIWAKAVQNIHNHPANFHANSFQTILIVQCNALDCNGRNILHYNKKSSSFVQPTALYSICLANRLTLSFPEKGWRRRGPGKGIRNHSSPSTSSSAASVHNLFANCYFVTKRAANRLWLLLHIDNNDDGCLVGWLLVGWTNKM